MKNNKVNTVLVAAGGYGTRLAPLSSIITKELFPILNKPVIEYVLDEVLTKEIKNLILVLRKEKKIILKYLESGHSKELTNKLRKVNLKVVYQKGNDYGDAVPIVQAKKVIKDNPFIVQWADSFALAKERRVDDMIQTYRKYGKTTVSLIKVGKTGCLLYAIPKIQKVTPNLFKLIRLFEKPGPKFQSYKIAFPGGLILTPEIFHYVKRTKPNHKGEISIVDTIDLLCQENDVHGVLFQGKYYECGNVKDLIETNKAIHKISFGCNYNRGLRRTS